MNMLHSGEVSLRLLVPVHTLRRAVRRRPGLPGVHLVGKFIGFEEEKLAELKRVLVEEGFCTPMSRELVTA